MKFWRIFLALARKEWQQLRRDRLTAMLILSVPLAQVILFGFAIDLAPRHWPGVWVETTALVSTEIDAPTDRGLTQTMLKQVNASGWIALPNQPISKQAANDAMLRGEARFILYWPTHPSQSQLAGKPIMINLDADYSDPYVPAALAMLTQSLNATTNNGKPAPVKLDSIFGPLQLNLQPRFALQHGSGSYLVPALTGVVLTLTLTLMASFALVREQERGTWEGLLSTPAGSTVIVLGKLLPYAILGLLLFGALQIVSHLLFESAWASPTQWLAALCFLLGQLGLGACLSLLASNQLQAMQLGVFFYLPSILLSGFMFPFHAMPSWARGIGEMLPLTHFLRVVRADLLRGANAELLLSLAWPIALFAALMLGLAIAGYRRQVA